MPGYLRLVLEHVEACRPQGDQSQPWDLLHLPRVDVLVEPWRPLPGEGQFEVHLDLLDPLLGSPGGDIGGLRPRYNPLHKDRLTILR